MKRKGKVEEKDFIFESDHFMTPDELYCAQMRVVIEIVANSKTQGSVHVKSIYDEDSRVFRKLEDFPQKEQTKILADAEKLANAWNYTVYQEENVFYNKAE